MTPQQIFERCVTAFRNGDYALALKHADQLLRLSPDHPDTNYIAALSHARLGNVSAAEKAFVVALKGHPKPGEVLYNQARMYRDHGMLESAFDSARKALDATPKDAAARLLLATLYELAGEFGDAAQAYQAVLNDDPDNISAQTGLAKVFDQTGKSDQAFAILQRVEQADAANPVVLNNLSANALKRGDMSAHLDYARRAATAAPDNHDIVANFARALERLGNSDNAARVYGQALSLDPANIDTHRDFSRLQWVSGHRTSYLQSLDRAIEACASRPAQLQDLLNLKGELAYRTGDLAAAHDAYDRSLASGDTASARMGRAQVHAKTDDPSLALADFQIALQQAPDDGNIRHEFATFLLGQGEIERAAGILDWRPPRRHLQRHIALRATCHRLSGEEDAYRRLYDYDTFTTKLTIECPPGFGSLAEFLAAVEEALAERFDSQQQPIDQTLFGGIQTKDDLWQTDNKVLLSLKDSLFRTAIRFIEKLRYDPGHPFLKFVPDFEQSTITYAGAWAVRLASGGGHVDHIHPDGWLSSAHYVTVPDEILAADNANRGGWLRLGAPPIAGIDLQAELYIRPEPGALILFPSYIWHGVEPFEGDGPRITTPFDMISTRPE